LGLPAAGGNLDQPTFSADGAPAVPHSPPALNPEPQHVQVLPIPAASGSWTAELLRLMRYRFWLKFLGVSGFMWLFFTGYFYVLRHPVRPVTDMPLTAVDEWVAFQPWAFWAYVSLWVYVGIPTGLARDLRSMLRHGAWAAALCLTGLACFYVLPTAVPSAGLALGSADHAGFAVLQGLDAPGNACPSLHVATALFSAAWIHRLLYELQAARWAYFLNIAWAVLIVYSTMAIKQHVLLDVLGGMLLATLFAVLSLRMSAPQPHGPGR
jgi:membrane-associated phospholipid phosphatase